MNPFPYYWTIDNKKVLFDTVVWQNFHSEGEAIKSLEYFLRITEKQKHDIKFSKKIEDIIE